MKSRKRQTPAPNAARRRAVRPGRRGRRELALGADCTLAATEGLKRALSGLIAEPGPVALDAAAVQRIDTAALQLLLAFVRDRRAAGLEFAWRARSSTFDTAAARLGLSALIAPAAESGR